MSKDELEKAMRQALTKAGKPQGEIDAIVPFMLSQPSLQTDKTREIFYKQWSDKL